MNQNRIETNGFSDPETQRYFEREGIAGLDQCGGCSFYAEFNTDWGLCCNSKSAHHLETVFEHFTCVVYVHEGWGPHSFTEDVSFHCQCQGQPVYQTIQTILDFLGEGRELDDELRSHLRELREYVEQRKDRPLRP